MSTQVKFFTCLILGLAPLTLGALGLMSWLGISQPLAAISLLLATLAVYIIAAIISISKISPGTHNSGPGSRTSIREPR